MKARSFLIQSCMACALSSAAIATWSQTVSMDFKQVYEAALAQDASIRASRASADAGREKLPQARAGLLPQISASASRNNNNLDSTSPNLLGNPVTTNDQYFSDSKTLQLRQPLVPQTKAQLLKRCWVREGEFDFPAAPRYFPSRVKLHLPDQIMHRMKWNPQPLSKLFFRVLHGPWFYQAKLRWHLTVLDKSAASLIPAISPLAVNFLGQKYLYERS